MDVTGPVGSPGLPERHGARARSRRAVGVLVVAVLGWGSTLPVAGIQPVLDPSLAVLQRALARGAEVGGGTSGVAVLHVESGRRVAVRGDERFPMASTFKVPIAVQLLHRVDRGEVTLDRMIELTPGDLHPGSGTLTDLFNKPGVALSVRNLLELMLLISDNSATDICLRLAGGAGAVTDRMRALGVDGIDVSRSTAELIADWVGVASLPPRETWTPDWFASAFEAVGEPERTAAAARLESDPRDTATPEAMARLLELVHTGRALSSESTVLLIDIMTRCQTGDARLKGLLPDGSVVAHKTGTIGRTTNDVGIITLPEDAGHVIVAAFVKGSEEPVPMRERAIAEMARAAYDFFLFAPARP